MSTLSISYKDLLQVSKDAKKSSEEAVDYAEKLTKKVCKKIDNLNGGGSAHVKEADYFVKAKIKSLNDKANKLNNFASSVNTFYESATRTDLDMDNRIKALSSEFKQAIGIKVGPVQEWFSWLGTTLLNSTEFGKWLNNIIRHVSDFCRNIWGELKYWYNCNGGKYVVDIVLSVLAICAAVITICTAGAGFFALCAIIGAAISIVNGLNNIYTSHKALSKHNEDPAWANRYGKLDKFSDTLRTTPSKSANFLADALDATEAFTDFMGVAQIGHNVLKNSNSTAYKNLFGDKDKGLGKAFLSDITNKGTNVATKDSFINGCKTVLTDKSFRTELWEGFKKDIVTDKSAFVDSIKYLKMTGSQGIDVVQNLFTGTEAQKIVSKDILKHNLGDAWQFSKNNAKEFVVEQWTEAWTGFLDAKTFTGKADILGKTYEIKPAFTTIIKAGGMADGIYNAGDTLVNFKITHIEDFKKVSSSFGAEGDSVFTTFANVFKSESTESDFKIKTIKPPEIKKYMKVWGAN